MTMSTAYWMVHCTVTNSPVLKSVNSKSVCYSLTAIWH